MIGTGHRGWAHLNVIRAGGVEIWTISALQQYRSGGLFLVQAPANTIGTGVLFTQFKKANVGTGPIRRHRPDHARSKQPGHAAV